MAHATRRGYTTGPARFPPLRPTQPALAVKLDLAISLAQIPTPIYWLGQSWVGPPITQIPSLIPGLSFSNLSPQHTSMPRWWAFWLSFQATIESASVFSMWCAKLVTLRGKKLEKSVVL